MKAEEQERECDLTRMELGRPIFLNMVRDNLGIQEYKLAAISIGYDTCIYLLFTEERYKASRAVTNGKRYIGISLSVDWNTFELLGSSVYDLGTSTMPLHFLQPLGDDLFVLGARTAYRKGNPEKNARIFGRDGTLKREMCLGDGIEGCLVTRDQHIAIGYFDEGVFGNNGWDNPLGASGLVIWDATGKPIWKNTRFDICDCYAINVDDTERIWFYYYQEFKLVGISGSDQDDLVLEPHLPGASHFAFNRKRTAVFFTGGYGDDAFYRYRVKAGRLCEKEKVFLYAEGERLSDCQYTFRGSRMLFITEDCLYGCMAE